MMNQQFSPITLGERLRTIHAAGFDLTETTHRPNHKLSRHSHELANIAFTIDGSFTEILDNRRFDCVSHSIVIKPPGEAHANEYGRRGARCFLIEVQPQRLESLYPLSNQLNRVGHVRGSMLSMLALRISKEMRMMDTASLLALEGLTLELIAELSRHSSLLPGWRRVPRWLARAEEILHQRSSETISLGGVAKEVDIHPVHLAREFRKFYGCTLGEYLRALRIQWACRKLSTSDTPLVEIALAAGFSNQAHFSRLFKRYTGITPTEYRSLHRIPR
jgi:AraC family transcriptional regulator